MSQTTNDLFMKWNEEGSVQENLEILTMLVRAGSSDKQIAKFYGLKVKELKALKKKYFEFSYAFEKDNINLMANAFKTLRMKAFGYSRKIPRKIFYKNKRGEDKYTVQETEVYIEPDVKAVQYLLEKFYGPDWRTDSEVLKIQEIRMQEKKEEWLNNGNHNEED